MSCLLDTHFVVWIVSGSRRLQKYSWLDKYQPWFVSPISLLEIQLLGEIGRIDIANPRFTHAVMTDPRFQVDDVPFTALIQRAIELNWTRDPFDRLLAAHSLLRRIPLCSVDTDILDHHKAIVHELR